jgi:hypothetical protein
MRHAVLALVALTLLNGCFIFNGSDCSEPKPYQNSRLTEPVRAPDGLDELDERRDLNVPVASTPPGAGQGRCLEEPPPFSDRMADVRDDDEDD